MSAARFAVTQHTVPSQRQLRNLSKKYPNQTKIPIVNQIPRSIADVVSWTLTPTDDAAPAVYELLPGEITCVTKDGLFRLEKDVQKAIYNLVKTTAAEHPSVDTATNPGLETLDTTCRLMFVCMFYPEITKKIVTSRFGDEKTFIRVLRQARVAYKIECKIALRAIFALIYADYPFDITAGLAPSSTADTCVDILAAFNAGPQHRVVYWNSATQATADKEFYMHVVTAIAIAAIARSLYDRQHDSRIINVAAYWFSVLRKSVASSTPYGTRIRAAAIVVAPASDESDVIRELPRESPNAAKQIAPEAQIHVDDDSFVDFGVSAEPREDVVICTEKPLLPKRIQPPAAAASPMHTPETSYKGHMPTSTTTMDRPTPALTYIVPSAAQLADLAYSTTTFPDVNAPANTTNLNTIATLASSNGFPQPVKLSDPDLQKVFLALQDSGNYDYETRTTKFRTSVEPFCATCYLICALGRSKKCVERLIETRFKTVGAFGRALCEARLGGAITPRLALHVIYTCLANKIAINLIGVDFQSNRNDIIDEFTGGVETYLLNDAYARSTHTHAREIQMRDIVAAAYVIQTTLDTPGTIDDDVSVRQAAFYFSIARRNIQQRRVVHALHYSVVNEWKVMPLGYQPKDEESDMPLFDIDQFPAEYITAYEQRPSDLASQSFVVFSANDQHAPRDLRDTNAIYDWLCDKAGIAHTGDVSILDFDDRYANDPHIEERGDDDTEEEEEGEQDDAEEFAEEEGAGEGEQEGDDDAEEEEEGEGEGEQDDAEEEQDDGEEEEGDKEGDDDAEKEEEGEQDSDDAEEQDAGGDDEEEEGEQDAEASEDEPARMDDGQDSDDEEEEGEQDAEAAEDEPAQMDQDALFVRSPGAASSARTPLASGQEVTIELGVSADAPLPVPHYFLPSIEQLVAYAGKFRDKRVEQKLTINEIYALSQAEFDAVAFGKTRIAISDKDTGSILTEMVRGSVVHWSKMEIRGITTTTTFANVFRLAIAFEHTASTTKLLLKSFGGAREAARAIRHARAHRYISDQHALYLVYKMLRGGIRIQLMHGCTPISKMSEADRDRATVNLTYMKLEYEGGLMYRTKRGDISRDLQIVEAIALCAVFRNMITYALASFKAPKVMKKLANKSLPHAAARWFSVALRARAEKQPVPAIMPVVGATYTVAKHDDARAIPKLKYSIVDRYTTAITTPYFAEDQRTGFFTFVARKHGDAIYSALLADKDVTAKSWTDDNFMPRLPEVGVTPWNDEAIDRVRFARSHVNPKAMQEDVAEPEPKKKAAGAAASAVVAPKKKAAPAAAANSTTWLESVASAMLTMKAPGIAPTEASISGIYGDGTDLTPVTLTDVMVEALRKEVGTGWKFVSKDNEFVRVSPLKRVSRVKILTLFARLWRNNDAVRQIAESLFAAGSRLQNPTGTDALYACIAGQTSQEENRGANLMDLRVVAALAAATISSAGIKLDAGSYLELSKGVSVISRLKTLRSAVRAAFNAKVDTTLVNISVYKRALIGLANIHDAFIESGHKSLKNSVAPMQQWRAYLAHLATAPTNKKNEFIPIVSTTPRNAAATAGATRSKPAAPAGATRSAATKASVPRSKPAAPTSVASEAGAPTPRATLSIAMLSAMAETLAETTDASTAAYALYHISRAVRDKKLYIGNKVATMSWIDEIACAYAELTTAYWRVVDAMEIYDDAKE